MVWQRVFRITMTSSCQGKSETLGFYEPGRHSFRMGDELQYDLIMKKLLKMIQNVLETVFWEKEIVEKLDGKTHKPRG